MLTETIAALRELLAGRELVFIDTQLGTDSQLVPPIFTLVVPAADLQDLVDCQPPPDTVIQRKTKSALNVRRGPGTKYDILYVLDQGAIIQVDMGKVTAGTRFAPLWPSGGFVSVDYLTAP